MSSSSHKPPSPNKKWWEDKKKMLATLGFSIQHITARIILTQSWKVEDQFDIVEKLETNLTQSPEVEDQISN